MGGDQSKDKRQANVDSLFNPLKLNNRIDSKLVDMAKQMVMRLHKAQYYLITEYFKSKQGTVKINIQRARNICCRIAKKDQVFYQCATCSYLDADVSFCGDCFLKQNHLGHEYVTIENQKQICCCGNDQISDQTTFCKIHLKIKKQGGPLDARIRKQLKLYIQLLLYLKQQAKFFQIEPHIFQYYGEPLFQFLIYVAKGDIAFCRAIASILLQTADILTNLQIEIKIIGKSLLQNLIVVAASVPSLANLLVGIINEIFQVSEVSKELLRIYYTLLLKADEKCIPNIFNKLQFDPVLCYNNQIDYFRNPQNCRLSISNLLTENSQNNFYQTIRKILKFKQSHEIFFKILSKTRISEMFNFKHLFSQIVEDNTQLDSKISMKSFSLIRKIINVVNNKNVLEDIIQDTLQYILKKKFPTLDLFFERIFALAVYKYYDFKIANIGSNLLNKLTNFYPEVADEKYDLIVKFLSVRDTYYEEYQSRIKKNNLYEGVSSLSLLANDQLYLKIIATLLSNKQEVISFYRGFIMKRVFNGLSQQEFYEKGLINNEALKNTIRKIKTFLISLSNSIIHNADQFIIQGNNGDEKSIQSILCYLAQIFQGSNASEFKENAQNIVPSPKVVKFIKEKLVLQGKKIHSKSQAQNIIVLSPCSQLFSNKLPEIVFQRMITLFCKSSNSNKLTIFAEEQCLQSWAQILHNCIKLIEEKGQIDAQIKFWLKNIVDSLLALGLQDKSESFMQLMKRIQLQINNSPLNLYGTNYKPVNEAIPKQSPVKQSAQNIRNNKKKLKLQNIRDKQKQVLEIHQMEEQKRVAECIVCKNSKEGNPFLLGHFGYKNIFCKVLQAQTPFLQFSSCGHYIHEDCLQQSHKGDFRIWYPCILCKSICNILLPNVSNASEHGAENQQEQLQRVIVFLKNLGGIYTFFYQDRKELLQFSLQNVEKVFPLLFKTLVYQITFYPILNLQYFQRSQLPVTKFLFDLLLFTSQKLKNIELVKKVELKGNPFFLSMYEYVSHRLRLFFQQKNGFMEVQSNLPKDITNLIEEITYCLQGKSQNIENISVSTKEYRQIVVQGFIKPPKDITQLQGNGQVCASCQKSINSYELCLLCGWLCCSKCSEVKKVHALESHLSQSVFIRNANGKYTYVHQQLLGEYNSLYVDYLGEEYSGVEKANFGDYQISKDKWENVIEDILNNRLHREIMKTQ